MPTETADQPCKHQADVTSLWLPPSVLAGTCPFVAVSRIGTGAQVQSFAHLRGACAMTGPAEQAGELAIDGMRGGACMVRAGLPRAAAAAG